MTDEETERTAELFLSLEGSHSLVVVEHDMKFIHALTARQPGQEGDRAARGQRARRRLARRRAGERARSSRSTLAIGPLADAAALPPRGAADWRGRRDATRRSRCSGRALNQYYGGSHILRNVGFEAAAGEVTVVLGRNGVGKTTLLKSLMGVVPVATRAAIALDGADITRDTPYAARAPRHRLRAAGARDLRPPHGRRRTCDGPGLQAAARRRCRPSCSSSSRC